MTRETVKESLRNRHSNADQPGDPRTDPIDVPEVVPDEVPLRVQSIIDGLRTQATAVMVCYSPEPEAWQVCRERLHLGDPPTKMTTDEICTRALQIARDAFVALGGERQQAPELWRIRLRTRLESGGHSYRHAPFRMRRVADRILFLDVSEAEPGQGAGGVYGALRETMEAQGALSIRCLAAVTKAAEGYVRMGEAVQQMAQGTATMAENSAAGLAKVFQVQAQLRQSELLHQQEMARQERWDDLVEKIATPFALELADFMRDVLRSARGKAPMGTLADELRGLKDQVGADTWARLEEIFTQAEKEVLNAMLREQDEAAFLAQFARFRELIHPRLEDFGKRAGEVLGPRHSPAFLAWIGRCDSRAD